jgi:hypothetical protein
MWVVVVQAAQLRHITEAQQALIQLFIKLMAQAAVQVVLETAKHQQQAVRAVVVVNTIKTAQQVTRLLHLQHKAMQAAIQRRRLIKAQAVVVLEQ